MADFDLSGFGDLSNFSLGGAETSGPAYGGGYDLGGGAVSPSPEINFGGPLPSLPENFGQPSGFDRLAGAVKGVTEPIGKAVSPILPLVGLGTAGVGMAAGIQGARTSAEQARIARQAQRMQGDVLRSQQAAAAPLTTFGSETLERAGAGHIPPAIQAKIDAWVTGAKAKANDYAARSGQGDSTMLAQWLAWIDQQGAAMAADYLQSQQQIGVTSLSAGANALGGAGATAGQLQQGAAGQQVGIEKLMEEANKALAALSPGAA